MKKLILAGFLLCFAAGAHAQKNALSGLISKCPEKTRIEFYKNLFFVNGFLASMKTENLEKCVAPNNKSVLGGLGKASDAESWGERDDYKCECGSNQLGCHKKTDWVCDPAFCWGPCDSEKALYSFKEKYIHTGYLFGKMPESVAVEFVGGLILDKGRVAEISVNRALAKHLSGDEIKNLISVLMGVHWKAAEKAEAMLNYISGCGKAADNSISCQREELEKKYDELFGKEKLAFQKYDDETLKNFWNIYRTLINTTLERKYLSRAVSVFKNLTKRNIHKMKCGNESSDTCVEDLFDLYIKLEEFPGAKRLKREFPELLKKKTVPDIR